MRRQRTLTTAPGVILAIGLALLLAGCALPTLPWQTSGPAPLPDAQQILHLSLVNYAQTFDLDPMHEPAYANLQTLDALVYSRLFDFNSALLPAPALADHYSVSADGLRYTIHLRPGARFSDGSPITSADVAFSVDRLVGPCNSYASYNFPALKDQPAFVAQSCDVKESAPPTIHPAPGSKTTIPTLIGDALLTPDPSTLLIALSHPDGALLAKLAEPYSGIVERAVVTRYWADWLGHVSDNGGQGTSGMFIPQLKLVNSGQPSGPGTTSGGGTTTYYPTIASTGGATRLTLLRSNAYWGPKPRLRQIIVDLRGQNDQSTADVTFDASTYDLQHQAPGGPVWRKAPARGEEWLILDPSTGPLADIRLRQALALALDKTALATTLATSVATNHLVPPGTAGYPSTLSGPIATAPLTGDVARAQALWQSYAQARCGGVASHCPTIFVWHAGWLALPRVGSLTLSARWTSVLSGIHIEVTDVPDTLLPTVPAGVVYPSGWIEDYPDPQDWLTPFAQMPAQPLAPYLHEPEVDALVAQAEATLDPVARMALYQQAENLLINDAIVIPIAQDEVTWSVKSTVIDFPANPESWIETSAWARIYLVAAPSKQTGDGGV